MPDAVIAQYNVVSEQRSPENVSRHSVGALGLSRSLRAEPLLNVPAPFLVCYLKVVHLRH